MVRQHVTRKLAAVLAADVAGLHAELVKLQVGYVSAGPSPRPLQRELRDCSRLLASRSGSTSTKL